MASDGSGISPRIDKADDLVIIDNDRYCQDLEDTFYCPSITSSSFSFESSSYGPATPGSTGSTPMCSSPMAKQPTATTYGGTPGFVNMSLVAPQSSAVTDYYPMTIQGNHLGTPAFTHHDGLPSTPRPAGGVLTPPSLTPLTSGEVFNRLASTPWANHHTGAGSSGGDPHSVWGDDTGPINFFDSPTSNNNNNNTTDSMVGVKREPVVGIKHEPVAAPVYVPRKIRLSSSRRKTNVQLRAIQKEIQKETNARHNVFYMNKLTRKRDPPASTRLKKGWAEDGPIDDKATETTHNGVTVSRVPAAKSVCPYEGCYKAFGKAEHKKRHIDSVHVKDKAEQCPFCPRVICNRSDNMRNHIHKHTLADKPNSRIKYHPLAAEYFSNMMMSAKVRKGSAAAAAAASAADSAHSAGGMGGIAPRRATVVRPVFAVSI